MSLWIELIFCMLTVMQWFLVRLTLLFLSLTFKCQSTAVVLVSTLAVAGRMLWNRVCPSFPPDVCQGVFLKFDHEISLNKPIFCMLYRFTKIKSWAKIYWVDMVKNGCDQSGHGTLQFPVSQNWADRINCFFFACWYKFRKAKSWFNHFWVGLVKNCSGFLVHETLKSAVS